jgi:menaquinol-cytochrome c reductase iron-sulfur subunit
MAPSSLNPNAGDSIAARLASEQRREPPRRNFLVGLMAGAIGAFLAIFPLAVGIATFVHPLAKRKPGGKGGKLLRVATAGSIPADGTPVQVPVIADLTDAWNREANQPIGAVYLRKDPATGSVECFNAICPHAGCFIGYDENRGMFQCPCHTSAFKLDGERIRPSPSPRDMDPLTVDEEKLKATGEVWIDFVNFYTGIETRKPKA